jgi:hypothetical protein
MVPVTTHRNSEQQRNATVQFWPFDLHDPATPEPVRTVDCGVPAPWSVTESVPLTLPVAVGLNVTLTLQLASGASGALHVSVSEKSALGMILVRFSVDVP